MDLYEILTLEKGRTVDPGKVDRNITSVYALRLINSYLKIQMT